MIRKDRLEAQLIADLADTVLQPATIDYVFHEVQEQLQCRLQEIRDQADSAANGVLALREKRQELKARASNVMEAIAAMSHSPSLLAQLATIESEIAKLDDWIAEMNQPRDFAESLDELREVLYARAAEIGRLLRGDVEDARLALAKYIDQVILTPRSTPEGPFLILTERAKFSTAFKRGWGVHQ